MLINGNQWADMVLHHKHLIMCGRAKTPEIHFIILDFVHY